METEEASLCNGASKKKELLPESKVKLQWSGASEPPAPLAMDLGSCTTNGTTAYFKPEIHSTIHTYDTSSSQWGQLPTTPTEGASLVVVDGLLTAVGGYGPDEEETDALLSLTASKEGGGAATEWNARLPPMPSRRCFPMVAAAGGGGGRGLLVVAGGLAGDDEPVDTVEVLEVGSRTWHVATPLPVPLCSASSVVCGGDRLYLVGGFDGNESTKSVFTCSLSKLLESAKNSSGASKQEEVWTRVADVPVSHSTAVGINGHLVAFGGKSPSGDATSEVFAFDPEGDSWDVLSHMPAPRSQSLVAVLEGGRVMVVGGWMEYKLTDTVDFATF